jgi:hypothetical protein
MAAILAGILQLALGGGFLFLAVVAIGMGDPATTREFLQMTLSAGAMAGLLIWMAGFLVSLVSALARPRLATLMLAVVGAVLGAAAGSYVLLSSFAADVGLLTYIGLSTIAGVLGYWAGR